MFSQHSAESSICCLGVQYVSFVCGPCWWFQGLSHLLSALSIILEDSGEKFHFWVEGVLLTESCGSVYQGGED
jgi:hypothetical protein